MNQTELQQNICSSEKKPLEIYLFVDPLCSDCWTIEPIIKKLQIEYGRFFKIRYVLAGRLSSLNNGGKRYTESVEKTLSRAGIVCEDPNEGESSTIHSPYLASIAIKAAELQGKKAGLKFFRAIQEHLFLQKEDISNIETLIDCAAKVNIDVEEFKQDLLSHQAAKAFQCDLKITNEMDVSESPTVVFFNEKIEDEGIKISGVYDYEVYTHIMQEMYEGELIRKDPPTLLDFLKFFRFVGTNEVATVYDLTISQAEKQLKEFQLQRKVERIGIKGHDFWKYLDV
ncbi:dithiol-disulfide isomerase [Bacillus coahuilensis m2-6]|uniref:ClpXP adapter SpxH family protein n=1 Tax=Bacillus coahuilensis TaxID=408580 RepID=UPI0001850B15|nr:ClpXP adapter SpxH family protein [Bacillus coahuilensis]KUP08995.1 dithiol-disulfide isomerase [Bacillus coahuilensis m2-6]